MKEQLQKQINDYCKRYRDIDKEQKLKITFNIKNGIAANRNELFFDAILSSALLQTILKDKFRIIGNEIFELELPIKKLENEDIEFYASSLLKLESKNITERLRRKFDEQYLVYCESKKIDIQRGEFKSLNKPYLVYLVDKVTFYAVGNKKEIEKLLKSIDFIGGKRKLGYGKVLNVKVEEIEECKIYRRIPNKAKGIPGRVNPPYFFNSNWFLYEEGVVNV